MQNPKKNATFQVTNEWHGLCGGQKRQIQIGLLAMVPTLLPWEQTMPSKQFTEIPNDPKEREEFDRQYMTPKDLAARWKVSESAIHHGKANSNRLRRFRFGRAVRFIRQEVYEFEKSLQPQQARQ